MLANHELFDRDGKKKNFRGRLPAYAYSRGVELHDDKSAHHHVPFEMYTSKQNAFNTSNPINAISDIELPNEDQISCYEQYMIKSNGTIVLSNFLENEDTQFWATAIQKKPESIQGQSHKYSQVIKKCSDILPFYMTCYKITKVPVENSKWKLCLITEHSAELQSEIQQIYLHMKLYYANYMQKVDLGVLDTCDRIMGCGLPVTETERFFLTIRDDYLMASQIQVLFKNLLSNQHIIALKQMIEILKNWENLVQKMNAYPKVYELSPYNTSLEMTELLEKLVRSYFKTRHYLEICFTAMINKEGVIKEQQIKDDMLCKYWYSMVDSPKL